jgi:transposase
MDEMTIQTERIDDGPLLLGQQRRMGIGAVVDDIIKPHGNRQGPSIGTTVETWISYILSEADHRMCVVEDWVADKREMLEQTLGEAVNAKDFTDDRLASVLRDLSDDATWQAIEQALGQRLIRVYDLKCQPVRLDSTTVTVYHEVEEGGLFQYGHSKDHRPDLPQFKLMLGSLDPMGMPVATLAVEGNAADDGLYIPTIQQARPILGTGGQLYVGDSKMSALGTRAFIQAGQDLYLTSLPQTGKPPDLLEAVLKPVWEKQQGLERLATPDGTGVLALGYETLRPQTAEVAGAVVRWQERVLVVFSPTLARQGRQGLATRLANAEARLRALAPSPGRGKRTRDDLSALQAAANTMLRTHRVEGLIDVQFTPHTERRSLRQYGDRPARIEERTWYTVQVTPNRSAIRAARLRLGWRLYVTNASVDALSFSAAVRTYRAAPTIERDFTRFKGPLGIRPFYVQRDDHATGLIRLLSLALRVLTLVDHIVREQLHLAGDVLTGLYPGNPSRATDRPTSERLLRAFHGITLTIIHLPDQTIRHLTPLSSLQVRILSLLGLSEHLYDNLASIPP